jgi:hypothetical protein
MFPNEKYRVFVIDVRYLIDDQRLFRPIHLDQDISSVDVGLENVNNEYLSLSI